MITNTKKNTNNPLVSVVITTYRRERNILERAIDSVLSQTYPNIELIVVDDNGHATDYQKIVRDVTKGYNNIELITHNTNQGAQIARNNGIKASNGELIAFLDDDDEWLPKKIELQVEKMLTNNNLAIVYCWNYLITEKTSGKVMREVLKRPEYKKENVAPNLFRSNFIGSNSFPLLRKKFLQEVGGYDINLTAAQDVDLWIRLSFEYDVACVKSPLVNYYNHQGERITNNFKELTNNTKYFYNKYKYYFDKDNVALANLARGLAFSYIGGKEYGVARNLLIKSYKYNPSVKNFFYTSYHYLRTIIN